MDPLSEAADLVYAAPPSSFVRGTKRATQVREALEKLFAVQAQVDTSIRKKLKKGRPTKLRLDGLDGDQIWSVMELWQAPLLNWAEGMADTLEGTEVDIHLVPEVERSALEEDDVEDVDGELDDEEEAIEEDELDDEDELDSNEEDQDGGEDEEDDTEQIIPYKEDDVDSELDDDIFRVAEMDAFAGKMEEQLAKEWDEERKLAERGQMDDDDDDDDELDSYDSEQEEDETQFVKRSLYGEGSDNEDDEQDGDDDVNVHYSEFFDAPPSEKGALKGKQGSSGDKKNGPKTKREKAKQELAEKIAELENEAISEKPWNLKGEAKASARPKDSLLEEKDMDVDFLRRTTPALTPEVAAQIEDVILKRYLDGKFNDCEVKTDTRKETLPFAAVLSQEKSKEGLAEEYAKDYAEKVLNHTPQEKVEMEKERAEIRDMFERLCQKLDALSSFSYTPKPPPTVHDATRPPDVAAVHMEEVVPTTETGNVSQTAPEEVATKTKGLGKSRKEMAPEERRAARRHAKEVNKKSKAARGEVILPFRRMKTQVKTANGKDEVSGGADNTKWTSSAQVFRKMEQTRRETS